MKKRIILFILLFLFSLGACNNNSSTNITENQIVTGIDLLGPTNVYVGQEIKLTVDVIGVDDDRVNWKSSDENIASVNNGIVKGLKEGSVIISVTSIQDPSFSKSISIVVSLPKATKFNLYIENADNVFYNENLDKYDVNLGQPFYLNHSYNPENSKIPSISYSFSYPDGSTYNSAVSIEVEEDTNRAKVVSFIAIDGIIISAKANYNDLTGQNLTSSVIINVKDNNKTEYNKVLEKVSDFKENEIKSLVSSTIKRTKEIDDNNHIIKTEEIIYHQSFINATYINKTIKTFTNNNLENTENKYYYQGFTSINFKENYFTFEYNDNDKIINMYDSSFNKDNMGLIFDIFNNNITYSYSDLLTNILSSPIALYNGDLSSFANNYIYANLNFELTNSYLNLTSKCLDENNNINYKLNLTINYSSSTLTSYIFKEEYENENKKVTYCEEANNLVYTTKLTDSLENNSNYLNLNQYLLDDYSINLFNEKDSNGKYDYSDETKYGAEISEENGLIKYVTPYNKSIILKIDVLTPQTANVNLDKIIVTSSNTDQVPAPVVTKDGIFAISAKKDENNNSLPGKSIFTFTSIKGIEKKIIIEFVDATLKSVKINYGSEHPTYDKDRNVYIYNSIFKGEYSSYFYINTDPDESKYSFGIKIINGANDGIALYDYDSDNPYNCPGFSYSIEGLKVGTYQFRVYVLGNPHIYDENIYEINVIEPYSKEYIKENIIGQTYVWKASISTHEFIFESDNQLTYRETLLTGQQSITFNYYIDDGIIKINSTQNFKTGMYFSRISEGKILFSKDFSTLNFYLETYDENRNEGVDSFIYFAFNKMIPPIEIADLIEHINNKTFTTDGTVSSKYGIISVFFKDGVATMTLVTNSKEDVAVITFSYSYDENSKEFIVSNSASNSEKHSLKENECYFDEETQKIIIKVAYCYSEYYTGTLIYNFEIN